MTLQSGVGVLAVGKWFELTRKSTSLRCGSNESPVAEPNSSSRARGSGANLMDFG